MPNFCPKATVKVASMDGETMGGDAKHNFYAQYHYPKHEKKVLEELLGFFFFPLNTCFG